MRNKMLVVAPLLLLGLIYFGGGWFFSGQLIRSNTKPYDAEQAQRRLVRSNLPNDLVGEEVSIVSGEVTLAGSFYENSQNGQCAVLLLHGRSGNRSSMFRFAAPFWERGCDFLTYDSRGNGQSTSVSQTYGYYEKEDAAQAYDWLLQRTNLKSSQVGMVGVSYGAAVALQALMLRSDIAFVLADSPYQDLQTVATEYATRDFGSWIRLFVPIAMLMAESRANFDAELVSPRLAVVDSQTPILLIHTKEDPQTDVSHSEAIYASGNPDTIDFHVTNWGTAHARSISDNYIGYVALLDRFLSDNVIFNKQ